MRRFWASTWHENSVVASCEAGERRLDARATGTTVGRGGQSRSGEGWSGVPAAGDTNREPVFSVKRFMGASSTMPPSAGARARP